MRSEHIAVADGAHCFDRFLREIRSRDLVARIVCRRETFRGQCHGGHDRDREERNGDQSLDERKASCQLLRLSAFRKFKMCPHLLTAESWKLEAVFLIGPKAVGRPSPVC